MFCGYAQHLCPADCRILQIQDLAVPFIVQLMQFFMRFRWCSRRQHMSRICSTWYPADDPRSWQRVIQRWLSLYSICTLLNSPFPTRWWITRIPVQRMVTLVAGEGLEPSTSGEWARQSAIDIPCYMMPAAGIEPTTHWLQISCSANWAKPAIFVIFA